MTYIAEVIQQTKEKKWNNTPDMGSFFLSPRVVNNYTLRYQKHPNLEVVIYGNREVMALKTNLNEIEENIFSSGFYINEDYVEIPVGSRAFIYNALFAYAVGRMREIANIRLVLIGKLNNLPTVAIRDRIRELRVKK